MIVIVDGLERTGKTTLCEAFKKEGFMYFKDTDLFSFEDKTTSYQSKIDTTINFLKTLKNSEVNIVIDRLHLSEFVYSKSRRFSCYRSFLYVDNFLSNLDAILITTHTNNFAEYNKRILLSSWYNYEKENTMFIEGYAKSTIENKFLFCLDGVDESNKEEYVKQYAKYVIEKANRKVYDFYLASPFFNDEQKEREMTIRNLLRESGYKVFAPIENGIIDKTFTKEDMDNIFLDNVSAIHNAKCVLAITDGKDIGTIWEAGYAFAKNIPIIYFAETLGKNPFNIMLEKSSVSVYRSRGELNKSLKKSKNNIQFLFGKRYEGDIQ